MINNANVEDIVLKSSSKLHPVYLTTIWQTFSYLDLHAWLNINTRTVISNKTREDNGPYDGNLRHNLWLEAFVLINSFTNPADTSTSHAIETHISAKANALYWWNPAALAALSLLLLLSSQCPVCRSRKLNRRRASRPQLKFDSVAHQSPAIQPVIADCFLNAKC